MHAKHPKERAFSPEPAEGDRWDGAELLSESLGYRRQYRPYQSTPPELTHYADTGCPVSPRCVHCPRFRCVV
jgi:hypothetical protein